MLQPTQTQLVAAGTSAISIISDVPPSLGEHLTWRLINDEDGTVAIPEASTGIVEVDDGHDTPNVRYDRAYTAPSTAGRYLAVWRYGDQEIAQAVVVAAAPTAAFASLEDVAHRLGRPLTGQETSDIPFLLNMSAVVIADAAGKDDGWAASLAPVPTLLRMMSVELVCRAVKNPGQWTQWRQQVGSYSIAVAQDTPGMVLSDAETLMIRRAVYGRTTDSAHVDAGLARAQDEYWLRKQGIGPPA